MNTPNDATDSQITRLIEDTEPAAAAPETSITRMERGCTESTASQLADIEQFLAITGGSLAPSQRAFVGHCLDAAFWQGHRVGLDEVLR